MKIFVAGRLNGFQTVFAVCCVCLGAAWFLWRPIQTAFSFLLGLDPTCLATFDFCWAETQATLLMIQQ